MQKKRGRKSLKPNKAIFETLYYNENITARELAKHYGVTEQTILNWAYQFRKEQNENNNK